MYLYICMYNDRNIFTNKIAIISSIIIYSLVLRQCKQNGNDVMILDGD